MTRLGLVLALLALASLAQADCVTTFISVGVRGRTIICTTCCTSDGSSCSVSCF